MSRGRSRWQDGRRAWERLNGWHLPASEGMPGRDHLETVRKALADVGLCRQLLAEAEIEAVKAALRLGTPWSEIATPLGLSRQEIVDRFGDLEPTP